MAALLLAQPAVIRSTTARSLLTFLSLISRPLRSRFRTRFWKKYYETFKRRGWLKLAFEQQADEYRTVEKAKRAQEYARKVRAMAPGLRIMMTGCAGGLEVHRAAVGSTDIWATELAIYIALRSFFQERIAAGEQIFWYIHHHVSLPSSPLALRTLFWRARAEGITGVVFWGVTAWGDRSRISHDDLGIVLRDTYANYAAGDGVLFWPGRKKVLESVRLEWLRDGIEDWESFRLLDTLAGRLKSRGLLAAPLAEKVASARGLHDRVGALRSIQGTWEGAALNHEGYAVLEHVTDSRAFYKARSELSDVLEQLWKLCEANGVSVE